MNVGDITKLAGRNRRPKRLGRGPGSGWGKTAGRGHKGSGSRAGAKRRAYAEGGQMPIYRRIPKRGFSNARFQTRYSVVNIGDLEERFESGDVVNRQTLIETRLVRHDRDPIKILGDGELTKKLTVEATRFSKTAVERIEANGGEVRVV